MKFKVKSGSEKIVIEADSLDELHERATSLFQLPETAIISLNGSDPLPSSGSLSENGLVSGDILRLIQLESTGSVTPTATPSMAPKGVPSTTPMVTTDGTSGYNEETDDKQEVPLTFDEMISRLGLFKVSENVFTYDKMGDGTIMITKTSVQAMEIYNVVAKLGDELKVENVVVNNPVDHVRLLEPTIKKQINQLRGWAGMRPTEGFLSLPDEILTKILSKLNPRTLLTIGGVCQKLRQISDDDKVWKKHYVKDFTTLDSSEASWRELYIRALRERKRRDRELRATRSDPLIHPYQIPGHAHPMTHPPGHFPGMIGGEYDLRPGLGFPTNPLAAQFRPRGDPYTPGSLIDPDANRGQPNFPHGNDHHGMFNPDGSLNQFPNRLGQPGRPGRRPNRDHFNPFGGGFM